jgi:hypothetical protein
MADGGSSSAEQHLWVPKIEGHVFTVTTGMKIGRAAMTAGVTLIRKLLTTGELPDMGVLQEYLYDRRSHLQLTAEPFVPTYWEPPMHACLHPVTDEPMDHWLVLTYGNDRSAWGRHLAAARANHEHNVELLRTRTGYPTWHGGEDTLPVLHGPNV